MCTQCGIRTQQQKIYQAALAATITARSCNHITSKYKISGRKWHQANNSNNWSGLTNSQWATIPIPMANVKDKNRNKALKCK